MSRSYQAPVANKALGWSLGLGIIVASVVFVAIALVQLVAAQRSPVREIDLAAVALEPPPPPIEIEEPDPPDPPEEPPPEVEEPPPPISLSELELALNPGTGGSLSGNFALPGFEISQKSLGLDDIFNAQDVDKQARLASPLQVDYPPALMNAGVPGQVVVLAVVDVDGRVIDAQVESTTNAGFNRAALDAVRRARFSPSLKDGQEVRQRVRQTITFQL